MFGILVVSFMIGIAIQIKINDLDKAFKKAAKNFEQIRNEKGEFYIVLGHWYGPIWAIHLVYRDYDSCNPKILKHHYFISVIQYQLWMIRHYGKVE